MSGLSVNINEMYLNNYKKLNFKGMSLDLFKVENNTSLIDTQPLPMVVSQIVHVFDLGYAIQRTI